MDGMNWNDDPALQELVRLFVEDLKLDLEHLARARQNGELDQVSRIAHQIKGCAAGYGFPEVSECAARLERRAKTESDTRAVAGELAEFIQACRLAIESY